MKQDTPDDVVAKLQAAFTEATKNPDFTKLMTARGFTIMNISGEAAMNFLKSYRSVSSWIVCDAGFAKHSPEEFGIPRPQ